MSFKPVHVSTKSGVKLSGLIHTPPDASAGSPESSMSSTSFVMFGPHPKLGGSMRDRVIFSTAHALAKLGARSVLLLDFKGVGGSEGSGSWTGTSEREDVTAGTKYQCIYHSHRN
jgi:alpha/beta superfamily hydrolase